MREGLDKYKQLVGAGLNPVIFGSAWIRIKTPVEIPIGDFDIYCPDFSLGRSPFRAMGSGTQYVSGAVNILTQLSIGNYKLSIDDLGVEEYNGLRLMSNDGWLLLTLYKVANYLSKRLTEKDYYMRYFSVVPLVSVIVFNQAKFSFNPKKVAGLMAHDEFTFSRLTHLYNTDVMAVAAVIAGRYFINVDTDKIIFDLMNGIIKPIFGELGYVYSG